MNSKIYVGSAVNLNKRKKQHFQSLASNAHYNNYLQSSWNLHGSEAFSFEVIEYCVKEILLVREQYWIDTLKSCQGEFGYNLFPTAGSPLGYKHSEEAKAKLSEFAKNKTEYHISVLSKVHSEKIVSKETKIKMSNAQKGKPKSEKHKEAMKLAKRNISLETRQKMSEGQRKRYGK